MLYTTQVRVSPPPPGASLIPAATPLWNSGQAVTSAAAPGTALAADRSRLKTALCCCGRRPAKHKSGMHRGSVGMGRRVPAPSPTWVITSCLAGAWQVLGRCLAGACQVLDSCRAAQGETCVASRQVLLTGVCALPGTGQRTHSSCCRAGHTAPAGDKAYLPPPFNNLSSFFQSSWWKSSRKGSQATSNDGIMCEVAPVAPFCTSHAHSLPRPCFKLHLSSDDTGA